MGGWGGPVEPSPTVDQAINGGYPWLEVECSRCRTPNDVDLAALKLPSTACIHDLARRLRCKKCVKSGRRPMATLLQLAEQAGSHRRRGGPARSTAATAIRGGNGRRLERVATFVYSASSTRRKGLQSRFLPIRRLSQGNLMNLMNLTKSMFGAILKGGGSSWHKRGNKI